MFNGCGVGVIVGVYGVSKIGPGTWVEIHAVKNKIKIKKIQINYRLAEIKHSFFLNLF